MMLPFILIIVSVLPWSDWKQFLFIASLFSFAIGAANFISNWINGK